MVIIKFIVNSYSKCPEAPLFAFEMTAEAAKKNFLVLKSFNFDTKQALEAQAKISHGLQLGVQEKGYSLPPSPKPPALASLEKFT